MTYLGDTLSRAEYHKLHSSISMSIWLCHRMLNYYSQFLTPAEIKCSIHHSYPVMKKTSGFIPGFQI